MTPDEFRTRLNRLNRGTAAPALAITRALDPTNDRQWSRAAAALFDLVAPVRAESHTLALAYYASLAPSESAPPVAAPEYTPQMTATALARFRPRWEAAEPAERRLVAVQATAGLVRHGEQAGRETVLQAAREDGARWARYDPRPPCCSWCTMMISRGPVYLSDAATSGGFLAHTHDTCVPEPVFPGRDWHGREQYEAAEAFYAEHAGDAGPGRQVGALRRAVAELGSPI